MVMSDSGSASTLSVGHGGFLFWDSVRLPVRYVDSKLEFVVKRPRDRARLKCKRVQIPLDEFAGLGQRKPQARPARHAPREFRAMENAAPVARRNKHLTKETEM